jgi:PRC-barrel domain
MHSSDIWTYRERTLGRTTAGTDLVGYSVEAIDGSIGKVDEATYDVGSAYVIVDTGPWIFDKEVMLPAGIIQRIDHDDDRVFVNRTKEQIKNAPELDQSLTVDESYRTRVGSYYGIGGAGYREWDDDRL